MKRKKRNSHLGFGMLLAWIFLCPAIDSEGATRPRNRGLIMEVVSGVNGAKALIRLDGPQVMVPRGTHPHPSLPIGPFEATIRGVVRIPIRADYRFSLIASGASEFRLESGLVHRIEVGGEASVTPYGQIDKGYMDFSIQFQGDSSEADSYARLQWGDMESPLAPFPYRIIGFNADAAGMKELSASEMVVSGRNLFFENRCFKCHVDDSDASGDSSGLGLHAGAPDFNGIGTRRNAGWFAAWVADPQSIRPNARMPKIFHGSKVAESVGDIAAWLGSLEMDQDPIQTTEGERESGSQIFEKLLCGSCHVPPGAGVTYFDTEKPMIDLNHVKAKFPVGQLERFLLKPSAHYTSTRMPDFQLSPDEARNLAAYLRAASTLQSYPEIPEDASRIDRGKKLVESSGCMACHDGPARNQMVAPTLAQLAQSSWDTGCVGKNPASHEMSVHYQLKENEIQDLQHFARNAKGVLSARAPYAEVGNMLSNLQCARCHGAHEGFPSLELIHGKLNPEWAEQFIAGHLDYRMRPWLEARMPGFEHYAHDLAVGMAAAGGYPPRAASTTGINPEMAEVGRKIVSASQGFACITCHAVNETPATAVFEAPGTNLGFAGRRLQPEFFTRWLLHPLKVDMSSKMPVYFDKGTSPLTRYFQGDANQQVEAVWHYLLQGADMQPPVFENPQAPEEETFD